MRQFVRFGLTGCFDDVLSFMDQNRVQTSSHRRAFFGTKITGLNISSGCNSKPETFKRTHLYTSIHPHTSTHSPQARTHIEYACVCLRTYKHTYEHIQLDKVAHASTRTRAHISKHSSMCVCVCKCVCVKNNNNK